MENEKRLIDANALMEQVNNLCSDGNENWIGTDNKSYIDHADVVDIISDAPTVDAVEVVHGRWLPLATSWGDKATCSVCGRDLYVNEPGNGILNVEDLHYCPNCGAKMDGGKDDGC